MGKVLIDTRDGFLEPLRGWGRYVHELRTHLPADVDVAELRQGGRGPELLTEQIVLPRRAKEVGAAVLHAPNCFLPLRRPCPGVVTIHDLAFERHRDDFSRRTGAKYRFITPRAARSAERVICVSQATADDVVSRYAIAASKIRVIANAPSLPIGDRPPPDLGGPYLLAIGDLRAKKNLERLVAAWQQLDTDHHLVLAGVQSGQPLLHVVQKRLAELHAPGYLPDAELDALLRGADALVHPSLYEGFGLVVAEAMARGVPVACSEIESLRETAGGAAALFDPLSVDDIARGIGEALRDRQRLGAAGLERARVWSWDRSAALTADVYRELGA